jgi:hypothetical protein
MHYTLYLKKVFSSIYASLAFGLPFVAFHLRLGVRSFRLRFSSQEFIIPCHLREIVDISIVPIFASNPIPYLVIVGLNLTLQKLNVETQVI